MESCHERFDTIRLYCSHLHKVHFLANDANQPPLVCTFEACDKEFKSFNSFGFHLRNHMCNHDTPQRVDDSDDSDTDDAPADVVDFAGSDGEFEIDVGHLAGSDTGEGEIGVGNVAGSDLDEDDTSSVDRPSCSYATELLRFRLEMSSRNVPLSTVESAFKGINKLVGSLITTMKVDAPNEAARSSIIKVEDECAKSFDNVRSDHKMISHLLESDLLVLPQMKVLGKRWNTLNDQDTGTVSHEEISDTFQYVPILSVLRQLLKHEEVRKVIDSSGPSDDEWMRSFYDGDCYKSHRFFSVTVDGLQLLIFYDDFGVANPLAARADLYKLGGIYWTILNLPAWLRSKLSCIFLAVLFYRNDLHTYSFDKFLEPLVADLKTLETQGVSVLVDSKTGPPQLRNFKGTVAQFIGDNLGINGMFNYVEAFNATTTYCRFCEMHGADASQHYSDVPALRRTEASHAAHLANQASHPGQKHTAGVRGDCILNKIPSFHVTRNYTVALVHDIFHGIAKETVCLVCFHLIEMKCFTLEQLNSALENFDYGFEERRNKPVNNFYRTVKKKQRVLNIKVSFAESACLFRLLPQMIGGLVLGEDAVDIWEVLLLLLECCLIIFAPACTREMVDLLSQKIDGFLRKWMDLFSETDSFTPKMHFLTHYPALILKLGPLVGYSEIRYEAYHQLMKRLALTVSNFRNVPYTLAGRRQRTLACQWLEGPQWETVSGLVRTHSTMVSSTEDAGLLGSIVDPASAIQSGRAVDLRGERFQCGSIIVCGLDDNDFPILREIKRIYVHDSTHVIFICGILETKNFNRHLFAFSADLTNEEVALSSNRDGFDYHPVARRHSGFNSEEMFVSLRHWPER